MKANLQRLAAMALTLSMAVPFANAQTATPTKKATKKKSAATRSTASSNAAAIKQLQDALAAQQQAMAEQRAQIQTLMVELQRRDAANQQQIDALKQTQTSASDAAAKAASAQTAASQNSESVNKIQTDLADVKLNQQNAALSTQEDQKRLVAAEGILNRFRPSGDVRIRGEGFLQNGTPDRYRARIRLRFGIDGKINEDFTGGIYIASGALTDPVSTNETLTSFFERKTVGFDRGWITYNPQAHKWLSLTGGKFAYTWQRTTLTFDPDLNPEGFTEKLSFDVKNPIVKNVSAQAMQLFFNESSGGKDSNAVGVQFASKLQLGSRWTMTPSFTVMNWNGADAIATAVFGANRVINANSFTNATQGSGTATRFLSGFMYTDYILDNNIKTNWAKFPLRVVLDYEQNLRAVTPTGFTRPQDKAYWLEGSIGQQKERNDLLFGYSFAHIDQDAVISQFNESDLRQPTNVAQHRFYANWLMQKNTTAALTWWTGRRLLNAAAPTPEPFLNRMQLDLIYKF
ncbi:MAG: hypothetical protein JWO13_3511 [Acidobacteriales bacterium]|nr:hypothetical protein [Terriglobales bacterium]